MDAKKQGVAAGAHRRPRERCIINRGDPGIVENLSIFRGDYDFINVMVMGSISVKPASAAVEKLGRIVLDGWK